MTYEKSLHALADPTRRSIFEGLRNGPRAVGDIARDLPVSRPAVSQHLKVLKAARLVRERRLGTRHLYSIDPTGIDALKDYLDHMWTDALEAFKQAAEQEEER